MKRERFWRLLWRLRPCWQQRTDVKRLDEAAMVLTEIMATPDKGIPPDMLANATASSLSPAWRPPPSCLEASTARASCPAERTARWAGRRLARSASRAAAWLSDRRI